MMLTVERETTDEGIDIVRVDGEVDEDGLVALKKSLANCLKNNHCNTVVDFSDMGNMTYLAVGMLNEERREFRGDGGDMKLVGLNFYNEQLLKTLGVLFDVYETKADAIRAYREAS